MQDTSMHSFYDSPKQKRVEQNKKPKQLEKLLKTMNYFNPNLTGLSPSVNLTNVFTSVTNQEIVRANDFMVSPGGENASKEETDKLIVSTGF
jgi:hypothetical protein